MTYADLISSAAGTKKYPGGMLTNVEAHDWTAQYAAQLNDNAAGLVMPEDSMRGAAGDAARQVFEETRSALQTASDHLKSISEAAKAAAPAIESGTAGDPAVKAACASSASAYRAAGGGAAKVDAEDVIGGEPVPGKPSDGGEDKPQPAPEGKPEAPSGPIRTETSSDRGDVAKPQSPGGGSPGSQAPSGSPGVQQAAQPQQAGAAVPAAAGATAMPAGSAAASGAQQPGGMPLNSSPRTSTGSPGLGRDGYAAAIRDAIAEERAKTGGASSGTGKIIPRGISPTTDPSGSNASPVATPVPVGNPSVNGGAVDPSQTSGRTASTTTSGAPGAGVKPAGSTMPMGGGMMGGMGAMGQGMGQQAPPAANGGAPRIKRDKDTEAVLDGTAARDKALIGSILTDEDLISTDGEGDDDELLTDERNEDGGGCPEEPADDEPW